MDARGSRRVRRGLETRTRLAKAAVSLFKVNGYNATTIDEIAEVADVSRGTFFNYFPTKRSVLEDYYLRLSEEFVKLIEQTTGKSARLRFLKLFTGAERMLRREGALFPILYREVFLTPDLTNLDASTEDTVLRLYADYIREGQRRGDIRSSARPNLVARVIVDLWAATLTAWVNGNQTGSFARDLNAKISLLFSGLSNHQAANNEIRPPART